MKILQNVDTADVVVAMKKPEEDMDKSYKFYVSKGKNRFKEEFEMLNKGQNKRYWICSKKNAWMLHKNDWRWCSEKN